MGGHELGQGERAAPPGGPASARRLGLLLFGAAFAALFVVIAITEGIGSPSVPAAAVAVVEDAEGEEQVIPVSQYRRQMRRVGVEAGLGGAPKPSDPAHPELRETVLASLISTAWIEGQAKEMGVSVHPLEVDEAFTEYRAQFLARESTYRAYLEESGQSEADVKENLRVGLLSAQIARAAASEGAEPSAAEIDAYYAAARSTRYSRPPTRDVRLVVIQDRRDAERALRALGRDDSVRTWRRLVKRYSPDPGAMKRAALYEGLAADALAVPLARAFFAAPLDEPGGPLETSRGFYVFEVAGESPGQVEPLNDESRRAIRTILSRRAVEESLEQRQLEFEETWRARTTCAPAFSIDLCANYDGLQRPPGADPACYEADPPGGRPESCPAPVVQVKPALPGTVTPLAPQGERLPQQPRPIDLTPPPRPPPFMPGAPAG